MRVWEFDRHDWSALDALGGAHRIPDALDALSSATTAEAALAAYRRIENTVVVQGTPQESSVAAAACIVALLPGCSAVSRERLIDLLDEIATGYDETPEHQQRAIVAEIIKGFGLFLTLVQRGSDIECSMCMDLLLYCAQYEPSLRPQAEYYVERVSGDDSRSTDVRSFSARRLKYERERWQGVPHEGDNE